MSSSELETITLISDLIRGLRHELGNLTTVLSFDVAQIETYFDSGHSLPDEISNLKSDLNGLREILIRLKQFPQPKFEMYAFDLTEVVSSAVEHFQRNLWAPCPIIYPALPAHDVIINGDDDGLFSVIANLISNAIEANNVTSAERIDIALHTTQSDAVLQVIDEGPGFAPAILEDAFRPSVTTRITDGFMRGLGLGLFSARAIIRLHGGTITLENKPNGKGAVVTVRLPLHTA